MAVIKMRLKLALAALAWVPLAACSAGTPDGNRAGAMTDFAAGAFSLTAADGKIVSNESLKGKPYAIFFGFTRCPDVCPTTLARMARLRKQLGSDGDKFAIVFVSVDPEHDKPADIGRYVGLFGTPVIGLTGNKAQLDKATKNFGVYVAKVPQPGGDYTIDHTASVYLMDRNGRFVTTIDYAEGDATALAKLKRIIG